MKGAEDSLYLILLKVTLKQQYEGGCKMTFNKYWKLSAPILAVLLATACSNTDSDIKEDLTPQEEPTSGEVSPENSDLNSEEPTSGEVSPENSDLNSEEPSSEELTPEEPTNEDLNTDNPKEEETDTEEPSSKESILEESNK
jgi:hypothetical protein